MAPKIQGDGRINTAVRVFRVIEAVQGLDSATLTELSEYLDIPKSTLHAYLSTLEELGYVDREGDGFTLGLKLLGLGMQSLQQVEMLPTAEPVLKQLAEDTNEIVWLTTEDQGKVVYIATERDTQSVRTYAEVGKREYMHSSASGKAILAHLEEARRDEIIEEHGLPAQTDRTITDRDELEAELPHIRENGFAVNDQETAKGIYAISAPIIVDGTIHGSLTVSGPADQLDWDTRRGEIAQRVKGGSNEIALNLKYS